MRTPFSFIARLWLLSLAFLAAGGVTINQEAFRRSKFRSKKFCRRRAASPLPPVEQAVKMKTREVVEQMGARNGLNLDKWSKSRRFLLGLRIPERPPKARISVTGSRHEAKRLRRVQPFASRDERQIYIKIGVHGTSWRIDYFSCRIAPDHRARPGYGRNRNGVRC